MFLQISIKSDLLFVFYDLETQFVKKKKKKNIADWLGADGIVSLSCYLMLCFVFHRGGPPLLLHLCRWQVSFYCLCFTVQSLYQCQHYDCFILYTTQIKVFNQRYANVPVCKTQVRPYQWLCGLTSVCDLSPGSHMLPGYYGMRRSFDPDFCASTKQFSPDLYSSSLGAKALGCDASPMSNYSSLIDSYYPETFADYRSTSAFPSSGGSFLPSSALSSLLPPFSSESSHLFLVWIKVTW